MSWFRRRLNWSWVLFELLAFVITTWGANLIVAKLGTAELWQRATDLAFIFFWLLLSFLASGWVLQQKDRSLWWLLLAACLAPLWLTNKRTYETDPKAGDGILHVGVGIVIPQIVIIVILLSTETAPTLPAGPTPMSTPATANWPPPLTQGIPTSTRIPENPTAVQQTDTPRANLVPRSFTATPKPFTPNPTPSPTRVPATARPTSNPTPIPPTPTPTPALSLGELVKFAIDLINSDRQANGLSPVFRGTNGAAQSHAEEMLRAGYLSHWGLDGYKPYIRYTFAGGFNYESENISGSPQFLIDKSVYARHDPLSMLKEKEQGLMKSLGHRSNILDKWHKKVNIGFAYNEVTSSLVQQFEGDCISNFSASISNTVLTFSGTSTIPLDAASIWFDPIPPSRPTTSQLNSTSAYTSGTPVLFVRPPPGPSFYYKENTSQFTYTTWPDPWSFRPETATTKPTSGTSTTKSIKWVDAAVWHISGNQFRITVDIWEALSQFRRGIYTIRLSPTKEYTGLDLTNYSIVVK